MMEDFFVNSIDWLLSLWQRAMLVGGGLLFSLAGIVPFAVTLYLIWLGVSAGHRRQQRARTFIDLLGLGLRQGRTVEETVRSLSDRRVGDLGVRFHLLAGWLERGLRLSAALAEVPRFLPAHIRAMLRVGEELGDLGRVLPVCSATLKDGFSSTQKNLNNLVVLLFVSPVGPALVWSLAIFVFPKFQMIVRDMESDGLGTAAGPWSNTPISWAVGLANVTLVLWLLFWLALCLQGIGTGWLSRLLPGWSRFTDWIQFQVPWTRQRMQRDCSVMLALLLDQGVPEAQAVPLATESTANEVFRRRAKRVLEDLKNGVRLAEAMRWLDDAGEFRWRLLNARESPGRFAAALAGWHEALEARAFQQEQLFSQALSTSFVLLNGLMVGLAASCVFRGLVHITELALW